MHNYPDHPDPMPFIERLSAKEPIYREAAAWTLGEMGSTRATRPLAGLLLREVETVEITGFVHHTDVVRAAVEAIRRIGTSDALYALLRALCVMSRAVLIDKDAVAEVVDSIDELGGPNAMREAADRVVCDARAHVEEEGEGLRIVGAVLMSRLSLCGDAAVAKLHRLSRGAPATLRPIAARAYDSVRSLS